jgi:hypothetical protein
MRKKKEGFDILFEDGTPKELIEGGRRNRARILFDPKSILFADYINKIPLDMERIEKDSSHIQFIDLVRTEKVRSFIQNKGESFQKKDIRTLIRYLPSVCKYGEFCRNNMPKGAFKQLCVEVSGVFSFITVDSYLMEWAKAKCPSKGFGGKAREYIALSERLLDDVRTIPDGDIKVFILHALIDGVAVLENLGNSKLKINSVSDVRTGIEAKLQGLYEKYGYDVSYLKRMKSIVGG